MDRILAKKEIEKGLSKISKILSSPKTTENEMKLVLDVIGEIANQRVEKVEKEIKEKFGENFIELLKEEFTTIEKIYKTKSEEGYKNIETLNKIFVVTFNKDEVSSNNYILIHGQNRKKVYEFLQKFYKGDEYYVIYDMEKWKELLKMKNKIGNKIGEIFIKGN